MTQNPKTLPTPPPNQITFKWEDWLPWLEEIDASDAEKRQFITTLWLIVQTFLDLDCEITPESCGQVPDLTQALRHAVLNSKQEDAA